MEDEKRWLKQLSDGDEKAYKHLFDLYYSSLVMFSAKYLKDMDMAEDLVQDVLYDFWKQRKELRITSLKSWLYISVRNRSLNQLEHDKVKKRYFEQNNGEETEFFLSRLIEEEVYRALKQSIELLPPKIKTVFDLILQRKTNAEIAEILGITEDAVKAYRKRGMKLLRMELKDFWSVLLLIL